MLAREDLHSQPGETVHQEFKCAVRNTALRLATCSVRREQRSPELRHGRLIVNINDPFLFSHTQHREV